MTKIELFRTPQGKLKMEFVSYAQDGRRRKVHHVIDFEQVKSKVQFESFCHLWALSEQTGLAVPSDALVMHG